MAKLLNLQEWASEVYASPPSLSMLRCADAIYMLEGWEHSAGARAENALAEKLEMEIIFQEEARAA